jgi:hypothetical protein
VKALAAFAVTLRFVVRFGLIREMPGVLRDEPLLGLLRVLSRVHQWFIRNVPPEPPKAPHNWKRRALIALLESDAVYDYLTQDLQNAKPANRCETSRGSDEEAQRASDLPSTPVLTRGLLA